MTTIMVISIITIGLPNVYAADFEASITTSESWTMAFNVMFAGGAFGEMNTSCTNLNATNGGDNSSEAVLISRGGMSYNNLSKVSLIMWW